MHADRWPLQRSLLLSVVETSTVQIEASKTAASRERSRGNCTTHLQILHYGIHICCIRCRRGRKVILEAGPEVLQELLVVVK